MSHTKEIEPWLTVYLSISLSHDSTEGNFQEPLITFKILLRLKSCILVTKEPNDWAVGASTNEIAARTSMYSTLQKTEDPVSDSRPLCPTRSD